MIIEFWPHTRNEKVASYRIRCLLIAKGLQESNINARVTNKPGISDVLVLSKRYDQKSLTAALKLKAEHGVKLVLDICDNHFDSNMNSKHARTRVDDLRTTLESVDQIIVSSSYLKETLQKEAEIRVPVFVIPDLIEEPFVPNIIDKIKFPVDELWYLYLKFRFSNKRNTVKLVWFGNAGGDAAKGGMDDVLKIKEQLSRIASQHSIRLTIVSNSYKKYRTLKNTIGIDTNYIPWSSNTISRVLYLHQISLIPISKNSFTLSKTANRVTTSLVHGLEVFADLIPSYEDYKDLIYYNDWNGQFEDLVLNSLIKSNCCSKEPKLNVESHNQKILGTWVRCLAGDKY